MDSSDSQDTQPPIWELISLGDHRVPATPTATTARHGLLSLKRLLPRKQEQHEPTKSKNDLRALDPERLDAVVGAIDWQGATEVLQDALSLRSAADRAWFMIKPPAAGYSDLLENWAGQQDVACIPSPAYEMVTGDYSAWLDYLPTDDSIWTLPRLERCWLRCPAGLRLVRALFDRLLNGKLGFALIGCDSWAWSYLRYVVPTQTVRAFTFQAFEGERLARWLSELATSDDAPARHYRHARSGDLVLAANEDRECDTTSELRYLAAQARGIPGAALQLWRSRLCAEPDSQKAADDETDAETIWIAPALKFELPRGLDEPDALILHALLLHDGLPIEMLDRLLPLPRFQTHAKLLELAAADVVISDSEAVWRVTPLAYSAVRAFLAARSFLLDDL
jgi:hypothetical protein